MQVDEESGDEECRRKLLPKNGVHSHPAVYDHPCQNPASLQALNDFQSEVSKALHSHSQFRGLLQRCLHGELNANQTCRILEECRAFERQHLGSLSLLLFTNIDLLKTKLQNPTLIMQCARVVVLLGVVYYLGDGLPQDDELALRYFNLGVALRISDAFVMVGIMARKGHGQPKGKADHTLAKGFFEQTQRAKNPEGFFQLADMLLQKEIVDGTDDVDKVIVMLREGIRLAEEAGFDLHSSVVNMGYIQNLVSDQNKIQANEIVINVLCDVARRGLKEGSIFELIARLRSKTPVDSIIVIDSGDPEVLYELALKRIREGALTEETPAQQALFDEAAELLHRAYLSFFRQRDWQQCERVRVAFEDLLLDCKESQMPHENYFKLVYHYYISIDVSQLRNFAEEDPASFLHCILSDGITSRREKMRRIISLSGDEDQEDLFAAMFQLITTEDSQYFVELTKLAYEALDDSLEMANNVGLHYFTVLAGEIAETISYTNKLAALPASMYPAVSRVQKAAKAYLIQRYRNMATSCDGGFARAVRLLIGLPLGSKNLVYPTDPDVSMRLAYILNDRNLSITVPELQKITDCSGYIEAAYTPDMLDFRRERQIQHGLTKEELLRHYKQNIPFIFAITEAIQLFSTPSYQPSAWFLSATYGVTQDDYETQLKQASALLVRCEERIFLRQAILIQLSEFFKKPSINKQPVGFAWVLMEKLLENSTEAPDVRASRLPSNCFDLAVLRERNLAKVINQFSQAFDAHFLFSKYSIRKSNAVTLQGK